MGKVDVLTVGPQLAAVRDATVAHAELAATIYRCLDDVWAFIRAEGDLAQGHNVVVYRGDPNRGPAPVEIGVQVGRAFDGPTPTGVRCAALPSGRAVHVTHRGRYDGMAGAYEAIATWAREGGHRLGVSWEVYGDWVEDPDQMETDIFFLLAP